MTSPALTLSIPLQLIGYHAVDGHRTPVTGCGAWSEARPARSIAAEDHHRVTVVQDGPS